MFKLPFPFQAVLLLRRPFLLFDLSSGPFHARSKACCRMQATFLLCIQIHIIRTVVINYILLYTYAAAYWRWVRKVSVTQARVHVYACSNQSFVEHQSFIPGLVSSIPAKLYLSTTYMCKSSGPFPQWSTRSKPGLPPDQPVLCSFLKISWLFWWSCSPQFCFV